MSPSVSVIIPVYNVEDYICQCLDSVCNQTFRDIEIICVDDGSTDNSLEILQEYEKKDNRIKVFSRKNSGPGATRNFGLDIATGEYILFVDSDDWIELDTIEFLYNKSKSLDLDLFIFFVKNFDNEKKIFYEDNYYNHIFVPDSCFDNVFDHDDLTESSLMSLATIPYNKLYKRSVLERNHIRFPEGIFAEDNPFHYEALLSAKRISIVRKHFSLRRRHETSISAINDERYLDVIEISNLVWGAFRKYGQFEEHIYRMANYKVDYLKRWYNLINPDLKAEYWKLMHEDFIKISQDDALNQKMLDNLHNINTKFYLNVLKSKSFLEFEHLLLKDDFGLFIDKKFKKNRKILDDKKKELKKSEKEINDKTIEFNNIKEQIEVDKKALEELKFSIEDKRNAFDDEYAEFSKVKEQLESDRKVFDEDVLSFEDKRNAFDDEYAEFNKVREQFELDKKAFDEDVLSFEDRKRAFDDEYVEFNKVREQFELDKKAFDEDVLSFEDRKRAFDVEYAEFDGIRHQLEDDKLSLENIGRALDDEYAEFGRVREQFELDKKAFDEDVLSLEDRKRDLDKKYVEFNDFSVSKEKYFEDRKKALDDEYVELNKVKKQLEADKKVFEDRQRALDEKYAEFDKYVDSKEKEYINRENEFKKRRLAFEEEYFNKKLYLESMEKELNNGTSSFGLNLFSKSNNNPKISIIIPVFNSADYINKCLESVINQSLSEIEVICIDCGSKDNSLDILKNYKNQDNRLKIFSGKSFNMFGARNKGLDKSNGEYVMFLNQADCLDLNACKSLYEIVKGRDLDILFFSMKPDSDRGEYDKFKSKIFQCSDLNEDMFGLPTDACQKVYKKEFIKNIRFIEDNSLADIPFHWQTFLSAKKVSCIEKHFYIKNCGQSESLEIDVPFLDIISTSNVVFEIFKEQNLFEDYNKILFEHKISSLKENYESLSNVSKKDNWIFLHEDFLKIKANLIDSDNFLSDDSKKFYLNVIKSRSYGELEYIQNY